jgi:hypothetical protein
VRILYVEGDDCLPEKCVKDERHIMAIFSPEPILNTPHGMFLQYGDGEDGQESKDKIHSDVGVTESKCDR